MTRFLQGTAVAAFKLQDQTGKWHSLSDCKGKWVVLYFGRAAPPKAS
ncbi:MAG TPA: redoxin domain-containing protein [Steroidobacteraceae bacterium]|jgi:peroxiredoxin